MKWKNLLPKRFEPVRAIEWVIALCTIVSPFYVFSPFYSVATQGAVAAALADPHLLWIYAGVLLIGAVLVLFGLKTKKPELRSVGWFTVFLARFFQVLTTILITGFTPISWIFPATVTLVIVILWWNARVEVSNGRS